MLAERGLDDRAEEYLLECRGGPGEGSALSLLAAIYERNGRHLDAVEALKIAVARQPQKLLPMLELGDLLYRRENFGAAVLMYRDAAELAPDDREIWMRIGHASRQAADFAGSASAFGKALELSSECLDAAIELVSATRQAHESECALGILREWQGRFPTHRYLAYGLSNELLDRRGAAEAMELRHFGLGMVPPEEMGLHKFSTLYCFRRLLAGSRPRHREVSWRAAEFETTAVALEPIVGRPTEPSSARLFAVPQATVLSREWWVIDGNSNLFIDLQFDTIQRRAPAVTSTYYLGIGNGQTRLGVVCPQPVHVHRGSAIIVGGSENYYHWMVDFLPALLEISQDRSLKGIPIVVNAPLTNFQKATLEMTGFDRGRFVEAAFPSAHFFDEALVPVMPPSQRIETLRSWARVMSKQIEPDRRSPKRLYLSRGARHRALRGEKYLVAALSLLGFDTVDPGALTVSDQIGLFSRAEAVVGPHGAAMTNLAFSPSGCAVVELASAPWSLPYYRNISTVAGHRHAVFELSYLRDDRTFPLFWDLEIDVEQAGEVADLVATLLDRS
jgi:hypothetical protein